MDATIWIFQSVWVSIWVQIDINEKPNSQSTLLCFEWSLAMIKSCSTVSMILFTQPLRSESVNKSLWTQRWFFDPLSLQKNSPHRHTWVLEAFGIVSLCFHIWLIRPAPERHNLPHKLDFGTSPLWMLVDSNSSFQIDRFSYWFLIQWDSNSSTDRWIVALQLGLSEACFSQSSWGWQCFTMDAWGSP